MPWRLIASNTVSAARQVGSRRSSGSAASTRPRAPWPRSSVAVDSGEYSANALPGKPDALPYAPVIIAVWFGLVSAIITERDSR